MDLKSLRKSEQHMIIKISDSITISVQDEAECVTWYNKTKHVTQTQQNYPGKHQGATLLLAGYTMLSRTHLFSIALCFLTKVSFLWMEKSTYTKKGFRSQKSLMKSEKFLAIDSM